MNVNKKLWSFIFGCIIATSFVWLISFGRSADVIEYFHQYPDFVIDYYALMITAISAVILTLILLVIMTKVFDVFAREHPFWLIIPSITFIFLTVFASQLMLLSMLSAAIPALVVLVITAVIGRLTNVAGLKNSKV